MHYFTRSNECMEAIMVGLEPQTDDRIISISGCGAQPLSFLSYVSRGHVLAVDYNPKELDLLKKAVGWVKTGKRQRLDKLAPRSPGFLAGRIRKIKANLHNLDSLLLDVSEEPKSTTQKFTKAYFSNAPVNLVHFSNIIEQGALVYMVYGFSMEFDDLQKLLKRVDIVFGKDFLDLYRIDKERMNAAYTLEKATSKYAVFKRHSASSQYLWNPIILERL